MEITVKRNASAQGATIGNMSVNGAWECFTLEPEVRQPAEIYHGPFVPAMWVATWKVPHLTAIPRGRYRVTITFSPHFNRLLPLINSVPGFVGVRIHPGNKAADTEGCTLVGQTTEGNLLYKSVAAFDALFAKIQAALAAGQDVFYNVS